jgi:hypothetical protein
VWLGIAWIVVGLVHLTWITRGFRRPVPRMHLE